MLEEDQQKGEVARWIQEIRLYEKESSPWQERGRKIIRRYKDDRGPRELKKRYNILWSNVQTLAPATYSQNPKPNIERRFQDEDDLGRVASEVLERATSYYVKEYEFDSVMEKVVLDRLLPGRGAAWVRYVPKFDGGTDANGDDAATENAEEGNLTAEINYSECVEVDYIHWEDFGHTYARTWAEVRAVWKKVYLTRDELVKAFGEEKGQSVPLDYTPEKLNDTKVEDTLKKATVYEIWDKVSRRAKWLHKDVDTLLKEEDDPLKLKGFFPCPEPFYATLANDSIIPIPDYIQYQDQALELDELTARINAITKAIKVAGVYDQSAEGVQRLLAEGVENVLIPVDQYAVLAEKGGLKGVMELMPVQEILQTLIGLYESRDKVKQDLYEITGISDIVRGATNPNETLGAQELKGQYANLRLGKLQKGAARFARDLVRVIAEIISAHFNIETIKEISGIKLLTMAEKQQMQMAAQLGQPLNEKQMELLKNPTWEEVDQLLKNDTLRCFRIDIETDSTIKVDQDAERDARTNFLQSAGGFLQQMIMAPPQLQPMLMEMFMFGVRGFKIGKDLESTFEVTLDKVQRSADAPQQPQQDPQVAAAQAQAQIDQQKLQMEMAKMQSENQAKQAELQLSSGQAQADQQAKAKELALKESELALKAQELALKDKEITGKMHIEHTKIAADTLKTKLDAKTKMHPDVALSDPELNPDGTQSVSAMIKQMSDVMNQGFMHMTQIMTQLGQQNSQLLAAVTAERELVRDKNGKPVGSRLKTK